MVVLRWSGDPLFSSSPLEEIKRLRQEMNRTFNSLFTSGAAFPVTGVFPPANITEDNDNMYVRAELPGVEVKDLDISIEENKLTIRGERKIAPASKEVNYHRREREAGVFRRTIALPVRIAVDKVTAECKDGILKIILPKAGATQPRQIDVKAG